MTEQRAPVKPGWVLISQRWRILYWLSFRECSTHRALGQSAMRLGAAIGPILMALVVVGLFQAGERFRN